MQRAGALLSVRSKEADMTEMRDMMEVNRRYLNLAAAVLLGLGTIVSGSPSRADTATAAITAAQVRQCGT